MTYKEIAEMIASMGLPFAYYQFDDNTPQTPPFICFLYDYNDVHADDSNYVGRVRLMVELYTDSKDFAREKVIENTLTANGLSWAKESAFIDSERMWQTVYSMEIILNG